MQEVAYVASQIKVEAEKAMKQYEQYVLYINTRIQEIYHNPPGKQQPANDGTFDKKKWIRYTSKCKTF